MLAFCRTGTRSTHLWALAEASRGGDPAAIVAAAAGGGYDVRALTPTLRALAATVIWTSILGIIALVGLARVLGFARNPALDVDTARGVVEAALPGFVATAAEVDPAYTHGDRHRPRRPRRPGAAARRPLGRAVSAREPAT